jgi:signal transduction histidine kinase
MNAALDNLIELHLYNHTILIVDDNPGNLSVISDYLQGLGFRILIAEDGESALAKAGHAQPDLILLDVLLPGIDGFETCRLLKAAPNTAHIPVIFMTALAEIKHKLQGFESGAVDYVTKPFQKEEVLARITTQLRLRELTERLEQLVEERTHRLEKTNQQLKQEITERKQAEESLQKSNHQLADAMVELKLMQKQLVQQERLAAVGQLAGGIAHDFNNILVPIIGYSELSMAELTPDSDLHGYLQHIYDAADQATTLIRQILAFSRKQVLEMKLVNLNEVVIKFKKMLQPMIREDIILETILPPSVWPIQADPVQLEQILMNLAINARDAMPHGGKLVIQTENVLLDEPYAQLHIGSQPGPYVVLTVSDTGGGMTNEIKERIFEPFFTTKSQEKGTGWDYRLSLALSNNIADNIWVYSEPGHGTTFKVYLPQAKETSEIEQKFTQASSMYGTETVLVVEDEVTVRQLVCKMLIALGYQVIQAQTPADSLRLAAEHIAPIHLLLTDVVMPQTNGRELYEKIKAIWPGIKVRYMAGHTTNVITHHGILETEANFSAKTLHLTPPGPQSQRGFGLTTMGVDRPGFLAMVYNLDNRCWHEAFFHGRGDE